jgi:hypothetical protein
MYFIVDFQDSWDSGKIFIKAAATDHGDAGNLVCKITAVVRQLSAG